jgi:hypothetical protein
MFLFFQNPTDQPKGLVIIQRRSSPYGRVGQLPQLPPELISTSCGVFFVAGVLIWRLKAAGCGVCPSGVRWIEVEERRRKLSAIVG